MRRKPHFTKALGGLSKVARECGLKPQSVAQWRRVPAHHVLRIESAFGVSRHELRPDIFGPAPIAAKPVRAAKGGGA